MRSRLLAASLAVGACWMAGCGIDPFPPDTLPTIQSSGVRITEGPGAADTYEAVAEVVTPSEIQMRTVISDGKQVYFDIPRGPAEELVVSVSGGGSSSEVTIAAADGGTLTMSPPFEFDPGYTGVEQQVGEENVELRVSTSRLTGAGQGQTPFTFKLKVR